MFSMYLKKCNQNAQTIGQHLTLDIMSVYKWQYDNSNQQRNHRNHIELSTSLAENVWYMLIKCKASMNCDAEEPYLLSADWASTPSVSIDRPVSFILLEDILID